MASQLGTALGPGECQLNIGFRLFLPDCFPPLISRSRRDGSLRAEKGANFCDFSSSVEMGKSSNPSSLPIQKNRKLRETRVRKRPLGLTSCPAVRIPVVFRFSRPSVLTRSGQETVLPLTFSLHFQTLQSWPTDFAERKFVYVLIISDIALPYVCV